MHKYALSSQGAQDMIKSFISVTISDLILMIPVSLLYFLVKDYTEGNLAGRGGFYIAGVIITLALIAVSTYIQYNATFLSTYVESGVRRITLAEKLRKIPLSSLERRICLTLQVLSWLTAHRWRLHHHILYRSLSERAYLQHL